MQWEAVGQKSMHKNPHVHFLLWRHWRISSLTFPLIPKRYMISYLLWVKPVSKVQISADINGPVSDFYWANFWIYLHKMQKWFNNYYFFGSLEDFLSYKFCILSVNDVIKRSSETGLWIAADVSGKSYITTIFLNVSLLIVVV